MWRAFVTTIVLTGGCNNILGIHDVSVDATTVDGDPCTTVCECRVDADCAGSGAHDVCVDAGASRTCQCADGYTAGATGACAWTGVVANPGFTTNGSWMTSGSATIQTTYQGMVDPGAAIITDQVCTGDVGVSQTLAMPRLSVAEPLVVTATYEPAMQLGGGGQQNAVVGIGPIWYERALPPAFFGWVTGRACLGPGQYASEATTGRGVMMPFDVFGGVQGGFCGGPRGGVNLAVDHVDIVPAMAGECPAPGTALNGDCEGSGGWTFTTSLTTANDGTSAGFAASIGANNSRGIRLYAVQRCDDAMTSDVVSVPIADSSGAAVLSIYHATSGPLSALSVQLDGRALQLSGGSAATIERFCVPAYMRGGVFPLNAYLYPGGSGTCTDVMDYTAYLDAVTLANDPACGTDPAIADPGFESGLSLVGAHPDSYGGTVASVVDAQAHGGTHDLKMKVGSVCGGVSFDAPAITPLGSAAGGPALAFWYRYPQGNSTAFAVPSYGGTFTPIRDGAWHSGIACLDPHRAGRPATTYFDLYSNVGGTCGTAFAGGAETLAIDDLSVTTDPSCPTM